MTKDLWKCYATEGDVYLVAKQTKQAEDAFADALDRCPAKADTLFDIAVSYSNAGYYDVAIELLEDVWTIYGTKEGRFVVPHLANCYLRKKDMANFLKYLQLAPYSDRNATVLLFCDRFPGIAPEEYYAYAYKEVYGIFPKKEDGNQDSDVDEDDHDLPF